MKMLMDTTDCPVAPEEITGASSSRFRCGPNSIAAHLGVFLTWFPAGGGSRKVSACTWAHQCLLLGIRDPARAGSQGDTWVWKQLWQLSLVSREVATKTFCKKLARKPVMASANHTFSCVHGFVQLHLASLCSTKCIFPSFFHSPPSSLSFSCSYNYEHGMVLPFPPLSLPPGGSATNFQFSVSPLFHWSRFKTKDEKRA